MRNHDLPPPLAPGLPVARVCSASQPRTLPEPSEGRELARPLHVRRALGPPLPGARGTPRPTRGRPRLRALQPGSVQGSCPRRPGPAATESETRCGSPPGAKRGERASRQRLHAGVRPTRPGLAHPRLARELPARGPRRLLSPTSNPRHTGGPLPAPGLRPGRRGTARSGERVAAGEEPSGAPAGCVDVEGAGSLRPASRPELPEQRGLPVRKAGPAFIAETSELGLSQKGRVPGALSRGSGISGRGVGSPEGNRWRSRGLDPSSVQRTSSLALSVRFGAMPDPRADTPGTAQARAGPRYPAVCPL